MFSRGPRQPRGLALVNSLALVTIVSAVALRLAEAGMPPVVVRAEAVVLAAGIVYGAIAVWIRSTALASSTPVQLLLMSTNVILAVAALGVAGPWLGSDLPPLAVGIFAAMLLYFDMGHNARHFRYVMVVAAIGLASCGGTRSSTSGSQSARSPRGPWCCWASCCSPT